MFTGATAGTILSSFQQSQDTLFALASNTGGKATLDYNDLSQGIVNAQKGLSSYYILGYYTTNTAKDGKFRRIEIKLADGRSARLDYRKGYYAEKEFSRFTAADKERQLEEALMLEDPITDLTIAMEVNYFKLNRAEYFVPVMIKIPGSELLMAAMNRCRCGPESTSEAGGQGSRQVDKARRWQPAGPTGCHPWAFGSSGASLSQLRRS